MFISRSCVYAWSTLPYLGRDPRRPEDLDSRGPDHASDALRYSASREERGGLVMNRSLHSFLG